MVVIVHAIRELKHLAVTDATTTDWFVQRMREATGVGDFPRFRILDNDSRFGEKFYDSVDLLGAEPISTSYQAPRAAEIVERVIGTLRRERILPARLRTSLAEHC